MSALSLTFTDQTRALTPVKRVSVSQAMDAYAGMDADRRRSLGSVANAIAAAAYGGTFYAITATEDEVRILADFADLLLGDIELVGVARRDTAPDQQHSPDESHFLDRERL